MGSWYSLRLLLLWCALGPGKAGCPGSVDVVGYGPVELVAAEWNRGGERAGHVELHERRAVRPSKKSRTYFANTCSEGVYNNTDYVALKLLGKTLRYTTDVSGAGCGCNAGLYLTALSQNTVKSDCFDYYCDANSVCGVACNELDLQEANQHAWHSTLKTQDDGIGVKCGLGGNSGILDKCNWAPEDYGRGGRCIDTSKPFQVAVSFHVNDIGRFKAMEVRLSQDGGRCHLSATLEEYTHHGRDGMAELSAALARGMTPTISYWASDDMMWMDGLDSRGKGHCIRDNAAACPESVRFYDFAIEEISGEKPPCEEQCPVGHCDRGSDGTCKWFSGKYLSKYKSYHCKVANCSDVPASSSMSKCWSWEGQAYYSIKHRHYPCPERHGNLSLASGVIPVEQQVSGEPGRPELEADVAAKRVRSAVQEEILAIAHILMRPVRVSIEHNSLPDGLPEARLPAGDAAGDAASHTAATALLAALAAPMLVRWEVPMGGDALVALSASITPGATGAHTEWPPAQLMLHVSGGQRVAPAEIRVHSKIAAEQLGALVAGALALQGAEAVDQALMDAGKQLTPPTLEAPVVAPVAAPLVDADMEHSIVQPRCLMQWHHDVCGHHALFNVRQLLRTLPSGACGGAPPDLAACAPRLLDEVAFWRAALPDIRALAEHGESTGRWPRSRVTCGILDEAHLARLLSTDEFLRGRASVVAGPESLRPDAPAGRALAAVAAGHQVAHGFVLGCSVHWIGVVVAKLSSSSGPGVIWVCDSYNRPIARLLQLESVRDLAEQQDLQRCERYRRQLRAHPDWQHQPESNVERALVEGVPEWWKGIVKSALFWRWKPREVRRTLAVQELECLQQYLKTFVTALVPKQAL